VEPSSTSYDPVGSTDWGLRLRELAARHGVPGATLGILDLRRDDPGQVTLAAHGVLSRATGVETTTDSLFQIGSITKVWTATLVMQLAEEGLLDLDAPVTSILARFRVADPDTTAAVTPRLLLNHTSGIDGDIFLDTGRGDDCLEQYVDRLAEAAQVHPLGATWSYCNSGYSLLGRVVEQVTGMTWDRAIGERLFEPLCLEQTVTLPEESLLHRTAVGHLGTGPDLHPSPTWGLPRSVGPAGTITASAADLLAFARLHLTEGRGPDGQQLLSAPATAAMAAQEAELPDPYSLGDSWGLGWIRYGWGGRRVIGHDGNTIGQSAFLRLLPGSGLAVTLLTNGGHAQDLYQDLFREVFAELADVAMAVPLAPPEEALPVSLEPHLGIYERAGTRIEIAASDGQGTLRDVPTGTAAELFHGEPEEYPLRAVDASGDLFAVRPPGAKTWRPVVFYRLPGGERYVHFGGRATPLVEGATAPG